ncbi:M28 family metallopeptidase [uncultured Clostridium sp.]|uniref:M28 family metallopeptidase n=1 Tax=uncultured Clostridium sp. TaxID=59620 RepID=UPI0025EE9E3F|nr:M28 family metallopeptidase [uncultured Clostridium sp.]
MMITISTVLFSLYYFNCHNEDSAAATSKYTDERISTREVVEKLCSNEYCNRLVGSKGNAKTAKYLSDISKKINLEPLLNNKYCIHYTQWVYPKYNVIDDENSQYKPVDNVAGMICGKNKNKAVVISAHFDNIGSREDEGRPRRGALDNASGVAAVAKTAYNLKMKSDNKDFARDIIFVFFNGEETDFQGSRAFIKKISGKYENLYNINIDCIGGKKAGKITLNNPSEYSQKLTENMKKIFKYNKLPYSEIPLKGGSSDSRSFEKAGFANITICQDNVYNFIHKDRDNPENIDFDMIDKVAEVICDFIINNDNIDF